LLLHSPLDFGQLAPTRDGRWLLFRTSATGASSGNGDILGLKAGDTTLVPLVATSATELFPAVSPDGRWLAYGSNESGTTEVYVRPFPETASAKWQVSTAGGSEPTWSPNGRELLYVNGKGEMVSAEITPGAAFGVGRQRSLFSVTELYRPGPIPMYSVSPDGQRFLMVRESEASQQSELVLAENWLQQLKGQTGK
jgi:dipeptidyl aminopeptidase/acylaminoacyl peptidase